MQRCGIDLQKRSRNTGVAQVNFGGPDQTVDLSHMPGRQQVHEEHPLKQGQIVANRDPAQSERTGQFTHIEQMRGLTSGLNDRCLRLQPRH